MFVRNVTQGILSFLPLTDKKKTKCNHLPTEMKHYDQFCKLLGCCHGNLILAKWLTRKRLGKNHIRHFFLSDFGIWYGYLSYIRKTCPCDSFPLTPHFYTVKLGFTGVFIISYFCAKTLIVRGVLVRTPQSMF